MQKCNRKSTTKEGMNGFNSTLFLVPKNNGTLSEIHSVCQVGIVYSLKLDFVSKLFNFTAPTSL